MNFGVKQWQIQDLQTGGGKFERRPTRIFLNFESQIVEF